MIFILIILGIAFLLCLWGCIYFAWKLYISKHSEQGIAIVDQIIKVRRVYRPTRWKCKVNVHIKFHGKQIEKKLSFWMSEKPMTSEPEDYQIPVLVNANKSGKVRILIKDSKALLMTLSFVCGGMALIFGSVMSMVVCNFK